MYVCVYLHMRVYVYVYSMYVCVFVGIKCHTLSIWLPYLSKHACTNRNNQKHNLAKYTATQLEKTVHPGELCKLIRTLSELVETNSDTSALGHIIHLAYLTIQWVGRASKSHVLWMHMACSCRFPPALSCLSYLDAQKANTRALVACRWTYYTLRSLSVEFIYLLSEQHVVVRIFTFFADTFLVYTLCILAPISFFMFSCSGWLEVLSGWLLFLLWTFWGNLWGCLSSGFDCSFPLLENKS